MIAPRPYTIALYLVLLVFVVIAVVVLFRLSERQVEISPPDVVRGPPPFHQGPYRSALPVDGGLQANIDSFQFNPHTVTPRCVARCANEDVLAHIPAHARNAGIECHGVIGLHISTEGKVTEMEVLRSGGSDVCDRAMMDWARTTRWTSAYNLDEPVAVWIPHRVDVTLGTPRAE